MKFLIAALLTAMVIGSCKTPKYLEFSPEKEKRFPENTLIGYSDSKNTVGDYSDADPEKLVDTFLVTINQKYFKEILAEFKPPFRWTFVRAIHNEATAKKYALRNNYTSSTCPDCGKVAGVPTLLFRVETPEGVAYFDIAKLCPPPHAPGCDLQSDGIYIGVE